MNNNTSVEEEEAVVVGVPVLALRDMVLFPNLAFPIFIGRKKSIAAVKYAAKHEGDIVFITQRTPEVSEPKESDLFSVGTLGRIEQVVHLPDQTVKAFIEGTKRVRVASVFEDKNGFLRAILEDFPEETVSESETAPFLQVLLSEFENYVRLTKKNAESLLVLAQLTDAEHAADTVFSALPLKVQEKQEGLATVSLIKRLEMAIAAVCDQIETVQYERKIRERVRTQLETHQKEYYLREQIKVIRKELGEEESEESELDALEVRFKTETFPKEVREKALSELKKARSMNPMSAEVGIIRTYLDWILALPWKHKSRKKRSVADAEALLNSEHYGLERVKDRVLDFLAVQARVEKIQGPILCFVGPPGVGKTSLARSIAQATGRAFVRIPLGGVRDEAEIRGHRRTYVGAMPGKILQVMKRAKTLNPLILLDELDKVGSDWRGDPASALLEVLDPEQNKEFSDHYLELGYDLSNVLFIGTANTLNMPSPLLDRLEIVRIAGYTQEEKIEIAKRHLLPRQMKLNGLKSEECIVDDDVLKELVQNYCREAGVRHLERELAKLMRKIVRELDADKKSGKPVHIACENLKHYSGVRRFLYGEVEKDDQIGVTTGLAWTEVGGEMLVVEAISVPGLGKTIATGKLGETMQESVKAASNLIRSRASDYNIPDKAFEKRDIHVHVPEGGTPKDGPSAGITICTAIMSLVSGIPVRRDVAMTGEITLRGRVLPIGGLKEKLLAALRGGIGTVLIPEDNLKDLEEIPESLKLALTIVPVSNIDQVFEHALVKYPNTDVVATPVEVVSAA